MILSEASFWRCHTENAAGVEARGIVARAKLNILDVGRLDEAVKAVVGGGRGWEGGGGGHQADGLDLADVVG